MKLFYDFGEFKNLELEIYQLKKKINSFLKITFYILI